MFIGELLPQAQSSVHHAHQAWTQENVSVRNVRTCANLISASFSSGKGAIGHLGYSLFDILTLHFSDAYQDMKVGVQSTFNCAMLALAGTASLIVPPVVHLVHTDDQERYERIVGLVARDLPRAEINCDAIDPDGKITTYPWRTTENPREAAEALFQTITDNCEILYPDEHPVVRRKRALNILENMHQGTVTEALIAVHTMAPQVTDKGERLVPCKQTKMWELKIVDGKITVRGEYYQNYAIVEEPTVPVTAYQSDFTHHNIGEKDERCDVNCEQVKLPEATLSERLSEAYAYVRSFLPGT